MSCTPERRGKSIIANLFSSNCLFTTSVNNFPLHYDSFSVFKCLKNANLIKEHCGLVLLKVCIFVCTLLVAEQKAYTILVALQITFSKHFQGMSFLLNLFKLC